MFAGFYSHAERRSRYLASVAFERRQAAINSVIGTSFWCYQPCSDWAASHVRYWLRVSPPTSEPNSPPFLSLYPRLHAIL
jgi:hypothetical protein